MKKENPPRLPWETGKYTNDPDFPGDENLKVVEDFLPSPEVLARAEVVEKVTLALSEESLEWFRNEAKAQKMPYQRMIRKVLQSYTDNQKAKTHSREASRTV